jgi:hypothetical protein
MHSGNGRKGRERPAFVKRRTILREGSCLAFWYQGNHAFIVRVDVRFSTLRLGQIEEEHVRAFTPRPHIPLKRARIIQHYPRGKTVGATSNVFGLDHDISRETNLLP